jgi:hypothetical protein
MDIHSMDPFIKMTLEVSNMDIYKREAATGRRLLSAMLISALCIEPTACAVQAGGAEDAKETASSTSSDPAIGSGAGRVNVELDPGTGESIPASAASLIKAFMDANGLCYIVQTVAGLAAVTVLYQNWRRIGGNGWQPVLNGPVYVTRVIAAAMATLDKAFQDYTNDMARLEALQKSGTSANFPFFAGLEAEISDLSASIHGATWDVENGLPAGYYRICSINSASNCGGPSININAYAVTEAP